MVERCGKEAERSDAAGSVLGILFWIAVWFVAASVIGNDLLLASPLDAAAALVRSLTEPAFWSAVATTSLRIVLTGTVAALAGALLGAISYRLPLLHRLLAPALQAMKSAPVACVIVIVLVAWGSTGALIVIVAFVALPPFYVSIQQALAARPRRTEGVLRAAGVAPWRIFLACAWPAACPFFTAASRTAVALSWRAGVTSELLCLPLGSIGASVYASKLTLDSAELLVWTFVVMLLSWITEKLVGGFLRLSERSVHLALVGLPAPAASTAAGAEHEGSALIADEVRRSYDGDLVLDGFSLRVGPGQRVCLMAPTGTGKSTLIDLLTGFSAPDEGRASAPRSLGVALQTTTLIDDLTAFENVVLAARDSIEQQHIADALAELLPEGAAERRAIELSGGMKRLTELVRALFSGGRAIILDEPFTGLDPASRERACAFILANLNDRPLLLATHDPSDAILLNADIVALSG